MRFNFKKISALAVSALTVGMTAGIAAAANYPAPFVENGASNVAIVVGFNAHSLDGIQASSINTALDGMVGGSSNSGSGSTATGGDSFKFEKSSNNFNIGDGIKDVVTVSLTDDHLPSLLADGQFVDDDNDEFDYTQEIDMANLTVTMFEDSDYKEDVPTIGMRIASSSQVLNYTLEFTDEPLWEDLNTASLPFLGKSYYVLTNSENTSITLLDSANSEVVSEGETKTLTIDGVSYDVSISFVSTNQIKLEVNGELTNTLAESETYKLSSGTYVGIKDILYSSKDTGISSVEFSLGSGKIKLTNNSNVEINDDSVNELTTLFTQGTSTSGTTLSTIKLIWTADDDLFVTEDSEVTMPAFEAVKLSYANTYFPTVETIEVSAGGSTSESYWYLKNFPLKDSSEDIYLLYTDGSTIQGLGKESTKVLRTNNGTGTSATITFDDDTDEYFVATWEDSDSGESYLMKATSFKVDNSVNKTTFQYRKNGIWTDAKADAKETDTVSIGNVELTVGAIDKADKSVVITGANTGTRFNTLFSKEGLKVYLPWENTVNATTQGAIDLSGDGPTGANETAFHLTFDEEDKNENVAGGTEFYAILNENSAGPEASVPTISGFSSTAEEVEGTDKYRSIIYSDLATEYLHDKSGDVYTVKFFYHGSESYADVFITSPEATVTGGTSGTTSTSTYDGVVVTDNEVAKVSTKNLIVVGGSCVNTAAASLVGGNYCGSEWTDMTGVASGEFLIKGYAAGDQTLTSGLALLVAGYNKEDTVNAATYLMKQTVDTSKAYKGTSATSAAEVVDEVAA
jgi:hypothetical protein